MSTYDLIPPNDSTSLSVGELANYHAAKHALNDYLSTLTKNTRRRHLADLTVFSRYLALAGIHFTAEELMTNPSNWQGMTYGLVAGFVRYQRQEGYAIGSINIRLYTVRAYCSIAATAHALNPVELALIKEVKGYNHKEGRNIDKERPIARKGAKKAEPVVISKEQAAYLKSQPDTPQGNRDALLMCLLLDHGLRCGEIAQLKVSCVNLDEETLTFYREKVDIEQIHQLTRDTRVALRRYLACVQLQPDDSLLMGSRRGGQLLGRMSERAITARMNELGQRIDVEGLSAHDGRHAWATFAIKAGTDVKSLQDAGGWRSPDRALKYAASNRVANAGVKLN